MLDSCCSRDPILGGWVPDQLWGGGWCHHLRFTDEAEVQRSFGKPQFHPSMAENKSHGCFRGHTGSLTSPWAGHGAGSPGKDMQPSGG